MCTEKVQATDRQKLTLGLHLHSAYKTYSHHAGTRQYLEAEVLPHVHAALAALLHKMQEERLQLAAGIGLPQGFRPQGWRPFCPQEWLANYLLQHKPGAAVAGSADTNAANSNPAVQEAVSSTQT